MSELRPATPATRPATTRPRADAPPDVAAPSGDELARIQRHVASQAAHEGAEVVDDGELGVRLVRRPGGGPEHQYAALPRWGADEWPRRLARLRAWMLAQGMWPSLMVSDELDSPAATGPSGRADTSGRAGPALGSLLRSGGWAPVATERVLWVGHASTVPHLDASLRIEAVRSRSVDEHEALERLAFGIGADRAKDRRAWLAEALERGGLRAYLVRVRGEPVAVARLSQGEGVAGLTGVGVHPGWRRRGLGTLVTIVATRAGLATGNRLVWLGVRDHDRAAAGLYARLGYRPAFDWTRWMTIEASTSDPG